MMERPFKRILLWLLSVPMGLGLRAQIMMEPELPSQGLFQQSQLWNILIVNNSEAAMNCVIQLSFQEEGTGRKIFDGVTAPLFLAKGANQLTVKDVGSVHYDYLSSSYNSLAASAGLLPAGNFIACYNLVSASNLKSPAALSQDCLPVSVEPLSPPQLAYPTDKSAITTSYPVFNWVGPAPANIFSNLNYKLILTEVKPGQQPADAIQRNPLLFIQVGIRDLALPYPSSYAALQPGKTYAWQVIAQNDNTYSAMTEIWSFTVKTDSMTVLLDRAAYPHLQRGPSPSQFAVQKKMKFSYSNESNDSLLTAKVYAYNSQGNTVILSRDVVLKPGMNFIDFDLGSARGMQAGAVYVLEMVNSRKENWDLRFRYEPASN